MICKIGIVLIAFCSCKLKSQQNTEKSLKSDKVSFTVYDSTVKLSGDFKLSFYVEKGWQNGRINADTVYYNNDEFQAEHRIKLRFTYKDFDLIFDSVPAAFFKHKQHTGLEFGITSGPTITVMGLDTTISYKFFAINPWDSGAGRIYEKPYTSTAILDAKHPHRL